MAKSEFYINSIKEVLNNTLYIYSADMAIMPTSIEQEHSTNRFKQNLVLSTLSGYWETKMF